MKHLISFNESSSFQKMKEIYDTVKNILLELEDEQFVCKIIPSDDIGVKVLGLIYYSGEKYPSINSKDFQIGISKKHTSSTFPLDQVFKYSEVSDVIDRLVGYMESEGWETEVETECIALDDAGADECDYIAITFTKSQDQ